MAPTNSELALPTRMPMNPPTRQSTTASMRNWLKISRGVGADGHPQADLAGPLGDGDEHDVHDAHAAHDQRNGGHDDPQRRRACRPRVLKMLETSALS